MAPGRPYIGREPFHQSSLLLFHQNKNFDVKVNSIADKKNSQKAIFFGTWNFLNVINGQEPFHQSSLFLFYQNKNFDVKVNSIVDEKNSQ